jgi:uncharacterized protein with PIN domain
MVDNEIPIGDEQSAQPVQTRKKRAPRKNATLCPACNSPMRAVHVTKNVGGFTMIPHHFACPNCLEHGNARIFKVTYNEV